jgi:hypothetical protein
MAKFNITLLDPEFALKDTLAGQAKFAVIDTPLQSLRGLPFKRLDVEVDETDIKSLLDTPVFDNVEFQSGAYEDLDGNAIEYEGVRFDSVLLTLQQSKNIISTSIQGRNGTIKEYISDGDWVITLTGLIIGETVSSGGNFSLNGIGNKYPQTDVNRLKKICDVNDSVKINSNILNVFGIEDVVITDKRFEQRAGQYNNQFFELQMVSDNTDLTITVL